MYRMSLNGLMSILELPTVKIWAVMTVTQVPETTIGASNIFLPADDEHSRLIHRPKVNITTHGGAPFPEGAC